jgi:hypothetical protein
MGGSFSRCTRFDAYEQTVDSLLNPERTTWQERAQSRADRLISLERAAHRAALKLHGVALNAAWKTGELTIRAGKTMWNKFRPDDPDNNNDDNNNYDNNDDHHLNNHNNDNPPYDDNNDNNGGNSNDNPPYPPYSSESIPNSRVSQPNTGHEEDESFRLSEGFTDPVQGNEPGPAGVRRNIESERALDAPAPDTPESSGNEPTNPVNRVTATRLGAPRTDITREGIPHAPREWVREDESDFSHMTDGFPAPLPVHAQSSTQGEGMPDATGEAREMEASSVGVKRPDTVQDGAQDRSRREPTCVSEDGQARADAQDEMRMADGFASAMPENASNGGALLRVKVNKGAPGVDGVAPDRGSKSGMRTSLNSLRN